LGVPSSDIYFMGLPDRGLTPLLQSQYKTKPYRSPGTLLENNSAYSLNSVPNLAYTGDDTQAALTNLINQTSPTLLFTTAPEDSHKDHSAAAQFVHNTLPSLKTNPTFYYFLIHYRNFPRPKGVDINNVMVPPAKLSQLNWNVIFLEVSDRDAKQKAVETYVSQLRIPQLGSLMRSMVRRNELVLPAQ